MDFIRPSQVGPCHCQRLAPQHVPLQMPLFFSPECTRLCPPLQLVSPARALTLAKSAPTALTRTSSSWKGKGIHAAAYAIVSQIDGSSKICKVHKAGVGGHLQASERYHQTRPTTGPMISLLGAPSKSRNAKMARAPDGKGTRLVCKKCTADLVEVLMDTVQHRRREALLEKDCTGPRTSTTVGV
jgi:hypothetical protein